MDVLHTFLLDTCKHILKIVTPKKNAQRRSEILARIKVFSTSGFTIKMYEVCQYYHSFIGCDFYGWFQVCIVILCFGRGMERVVL